MRRCPTSVICNHRWRGTVEVITCLTSRHPRTDGGESKVFYRVCRSPGSVSRRCPRPGEISWGWSLYRSPPNPRPDGSSGSGHNLRSVPLGIWSTVVTRTLVTLVCTLSTYNHTVFRPSSLNTTMSFPSSHTSGHPRSPERTIKRQGVRNLKIWILSSLSGLREVLLKLQ